MTRKARRAIRSAGVHTRSDVQIWMAASSFRSGNFVPAAGVETRAPPIVCLTTASVLRLAGGKPLITMTAKKYNVGIIGYGWVSGAHIAALARIAVVR